MRTAKHSLCAPVAVMLKFFTVFVWCTVLLLTVAPVSAHERDVLRIAGWDVYADPENKNKTIGYRSFEEKFGVRIEFQPLAHLDAIVDVAESDSDYDVFIISNEGIRILHDMGLIVPLQLDRLPHYQSLHHRLCYTEWALFDGKVFAVPWAWGPTGLLYVPLISTITYLPSPASPEAIFTLRSASWNWEIQRFTFACTLAAAN